MPGLHKFVGGRLVAAQELDRLRPIIGADASRNALRRIDRDGELGAVRLPVTGHHRTQAEPRELRLGRRHADNAATVANHHIDRFGGHFGRRHDQIAFVFTIFVVGHDNEFTFSDVLNR